ncbi:MAG: transferrin receptor-like dimerization domain-containing protein [Pseudomonadales bacterium]|jgi:N-acetylated-alpha-linked acidic dipeptidase
MTLRFLTPALAALALASTPLLQANEGPLLGFGPESSAAQHALEARFSAALSASDQDQWLKTLTAEPHHVGSAAGIRNVQWMKEQFESWGYETEVVRYDVSIPFPTVRRVALTAPEAFEAVLTEAELAEDPSTQAPEGLLPPYHAFSAAGDVEAELVFVNYGLKEDYEALARRGIDVKGKIVLAKYGRSWRGIKPKLAAEKGAIGALIYSDPADDGYGQGDPYPRGPFKHETGVQRGSVMDLPLRPGDILTPYAGAKEGTPRLPLEEVETLTPIPVLPLSYADATPLLKALGGEVAPTSWFGQLPFAYHLGPGPARVRLTLDFDYQTVPAYNVIARLPGARLPEQWILRGNHHDGWNHGAADPISGLVAMLAEAKALGALAAEGHRLDRTVMYAAWDAEEQGLIGSTEWVEDHAEALREHLVAYLNTDGNSRGFVGLGGSHSLQRLMNEVAEATADPILEVPVTDRLRAKLRLSADKADQHEAQAPELPIAPLGSGSDYSPFLQHLGIASLNTSFGGEGPSGSYHTLYDTYAHYTRFRDPGLRYGVALAELNGRATLRLAQAPLLPFEFEGVSAAVDRFLSDLEGATEKQRTAQQQRTARLKDGSYALALDPEGAVAPPEAQRPVPYFNFAPLRNAHAQLAEAAKRYGALTADPTALPEALRATLDRMLAQAEAQLTDPEGLPRRPWFRHFLYAPGFYTGYGVKTLPAVREAIEEEEYEQVAQEVARTAARLEALTAHIEAMNALLEAPR